MKRSTRVEMANETVAICDAGFYTSASGKRVEFKESIHAAMAGTVLYSPEKPPQVLGVSARYGTEIKVTDETTCAALERLNAEPVAHLACLNFASAKNPGGGFLNGAQAQEEALARTSALYPCLLRQPEYYEKNRANGSSLYLDLIIFSPRVPFFRRDDGSFLEDSVLASVITAPAPNAGAVTTNEPRRLGEVELTLRRRAEMVLEIALAHEVTHLVLGAWGCGVFRNDPGTVARIFKDLLDGKFRNYFAKVVFAVYDTSIERGTYGAFREVLGN